MAAVGFPDVVLGHKFDPGMSAAVAGAIDVGGGDAACFAALRGIVCLIATDAAFFENLGEDVVFVGVLVFDGAFHEVFDVAIGGAPVFAGLAHFLEGPVDFVFGDF